MTLLDGKNAARTMTSSALGDLAAAGVQWLAPRMHQLRAAHRRPDCVHVITTGILIALLTGIAMTLRWFEPSP